MTGTGKGRFHIPTSTEMEQGSSSRSMKTLFQSHQANVKSNIKNKTPADDSFTSRLASGQQKCATGVSSSTVVQNLKSAAVSSTSSPCIQSTLVTASVKNVGNSGSSHLGHQAKVANGQIPNKQSDRFIQNYSSTNSASVPIQQQRTAVSTNGAESVARQINSSNTGIIIKAAGNNSRTDSASVKTSSAAATSDSSLPAPVKSVTPETPPRPGGNSSSLVVSARQRGNPVLKFIRNVPWEYGDIVPDYVMGQTSCALFLSLRYHQLNNNYIHERLKKLGHSFNLRVLLVQVDIKDPHHCLKELAKICLLSDCTLILAWSPEEAGRYLETYKSFENKPPDLIMEKVETNFIGRVSDFFTCARKVNKTDAMTLLTTFGTVADVAQASEEDMSLCPGFGPQKAKRLHNIFHEPFLKAKKQKAGQTEQGQSHTGTPQGTPTKQR